MQNFLATTIKNYNSQIEFVKERSFSSKSQKITIDSKEKRNEIPHEDLINKLKERHERFDEIKNKVVKKIANIVKIANNNKFWMNIRKKNHSVSIICIKNKEISVEKFYNNFINYQLSFINKGYSILINFFEFLKKKMANLVCALNKNLKQIDSIKMLAINSDINRIKLNNYLN